MRARRDENRKIISVWLSGREECPPAEPEKGYTLCRFYCGKTETGDAVLRLIKNNNS